MTETDLAKITFRMVSHVNTSYQHIAMYESINFNPIILMRVHTTICHDGTFGRAYTHYTVNGKKYKTKDNLLAAMTEYERLTKR